jgi:thymidylate kinase
MGNVPVHVQKLLQLRRLQDEDSHSLERIALDSRVLIIEGISGSGKDTFQAYLKEKLKGRVVYDYSEGELLYSWKHSQIDGICELRIKFMKLFVNHVRDILTQDETAVFLLNRFHLSAYVWTVARQPELKTEYEAIINILRTLPVHVFILQLDENEIEKRTLHPERSGAWFQKYRQQMVTKDGFRDKLDRYIWQQKLMLEKAETQQIPYSVIKLSSAPRTRIKERWVRIPEARSILFHSTRMNPAAAKLSPGKREVSRSLKEKN